MSKKPVLKSRVAAAKTKGSSSGPREQRGRAPKRKLFGKYIVADPEICHGKLTFAGRVGLDLLEGFFGFRLWRSPLFWLLQDLLYGFFFNRFCLGQAGTFAFPVNQDSDFWDQVHC